MWQFGVKMDIEQAKKKIAEISSSTGTKNPKVLISELCTIVKFLIHELDRVKHPTVTTLSKRLPEDLELNRDRDVPAGIPSMLPPIPEYPPPIRTREGTAGDAK